MKTKTNRIVIVAMMALTSLSALAQEKGITPQLLDQMRKEAVQTPQDKALQNALATQGIQALAVAAVNDIPGGTYFSHKVKSSGITDQKGSGRCWLFTGLNVMRARMMQTHHLGTVTLSQNYVSFYDQLEKANLFLQSIIDNVKKPMDDRVVDWLFKNPIGDGGTFTGVSDLVRPASARNGSQGRQGPSPASQEGRAAQGSVPPAGTPHGRAPHQVHLDTHRQGRQPARHPRVHTAAVLSGIHRQRPQGQLRDVHERPLARLLQDVRD